VPPADALSNRGMNAILDADAARHWVRDRRVGWAIDVGGWTRDTKAPVGAGGVAFERQLHGRRIRMNLHVGPGTVAPRPVASTMSDRDVFDRSIAFAGEFLRTNGRRPAGVHLFLHKGFSHMVVAYWVGQCWARRYSIVLPDPATGRAMEFAFAFGFFGPFTEYCGAIPAMDRLVQSLEWPAPGV
jgi:hypothetical protein